MTGFGWKGGIGTSSRLLPKDLGDFTLGVMVLTNTGAASDLRIDGIPIGKELTPNSYSESTPGSIMLIVGTDAPLSSRQLGRIAKRAAFGLARTGATASHGSGDFVIAFSTGNIISGSSRQSATPSEFVAEQQLSSFFRAVIEAIEEAIINSILKAETIVGRDGNTLIGIPIERVTDIISKYR